MLVSPKGRYADQKTVVRRFDHAEHSQMKITWLHIPVVAVHDPAGLLFIGIVNIPLLHGLSPDVFYICVVKHLFIIPYIPENSKFFLDFRPFEDKKNAA